MLIIQTVCKPKKTKQMKNNVQKFKEVVESLPNQFSSEAFMQRLTSKGADESTIKKGLKYLPNLATRTAKGSRMWTKIEQSKVVAANVSAMCSLGIKSTALSNLTNDN